jgi:RHH-type proline utilization regulon transcriptional repressor/proline dehydrogenase/delta 1-pyrroline-5-carboxylate dehydrogenase
VGEAALTGADAERYMEAYRSAIAVIGARQRGDDIFAAPSISVKLSALHPRFEHGQRRRVLRELTPRLLELAQLAMAKRMALTVDTEEADRLMLTSTSLRRRAIPAWPAGTDLVSPCRPTRSGRWR